jgi:hypothetical protein
MKLGFNIDRLDYSVLTKRSLNEIAGDEGSDEWQSNRKAGGGKGTVRKGAEWLQGSANRATGKSGDKKAQKQEPEVKATKSSVVKEKRNSSSTARKKASVKKKSRKAA